MATERLVMRNVKEILRAKWELGLSNRQTAKSARVSPASVVNVVRRARSAGLNTYAEVVALDEADLEPLAVGLDVFRCLPAAEGRTEAEIEAALSAWCDRYLPKDTSGPEELGVRKEKGPPRRGEEGPRSVMSACQMEER